MENFLETQTQPKKRSKLVIFGVAGLILAFVLGFALGNGTIAVDGGKIQITRGEQPALSADYSLLWDALNLLNSKYVDRPLDQQKLMYGAVAGLVGAAGDPYTAFLDPEEARSFNEQLRGSFEGIGAEIGIKEEQLVIVAPLENTPASRAGILPGDMILAIDGQSTQGMSVDEAVSRIRGKAGTIVTLTILHPNQQTAVEIAITRSNIEIKSVELSTQEIAGKKIAVIQINQFGDDTKGLLNHMVDVIASGDYQGIVVDLRNNPGGYLQTAVDTISYWVDAGQVALKEIGYNDSVKEYKTSGVPRLKGMPTVVLVNGGSASASEIVAGALQDYKVATLVGEQTFGKGSVQELQELKFDSEIKVTVAKWYTPQDRGIDKTGLTPDEVVELTAEDFENERDPQMERALEILK